MKFTTFFGLRSQTTRLQGNTISLGLRRYRSITFSGAPVMGNLCLRPWPSVLPVRYTSRCRNTEIQRWTDPCSLAVTEGILVSFFSSAY
jgi:hypothetical protein